MPNITNPTAIQFTNAMARPMADAMLQSYATAKALLNYWNANSMSTLITNDASVVMDGAGVTDGRHAITGAMVTNVVTRAQEIITDYEAGSSAKLNTVEALAVNGQSKF
jgi:hypothetical protein